MPASTVAGGVGPGATGLVFHQLTKSFPNTNRPSVASLSMHVAPSEILGLVGLNGAGKTTTIRLAVGAIRPTAGAVSVAGYDIVHDKVEASRRLGWVSESPNFDPLGRAETMLRYFAGLRGLRGHDAARHCSRLMDAVGLGEFKDGRFRSFSQGMKKRFALAVAMVGDPEVMLLDEILNGLDPEGIAFVRSLMITWRREGKAVLLSSHLLNETQRIADRVAILHRGRLVRILTRSELSQAGSRVLRITVTDLDADSISLLSKKGVLKRDGTTVWLSEPTEEADEIGFDLVRRGYHVKELVLEPVRLEDLFFDEIERLESGDEHDTPAP